MRPFRHLIKNFVFDLLPPLLLLAAPGVHAGGITFVEVHKDGDTGLNGASSKV